MKYRASVCFGNIFLLMMLSGVLVAQNDSVPVARIVGQLAGEGGEFAELFEQEVVTREERVLDRHVVESKTRRVVLNRVAEPSEEAGRSRASVAEGGWFTEGSEASSVLPHGGSAIVMATVFEDGLTKLQWFDQGQLCAAWSRVNWKDLEGVNRFEAFGKRYHMMVLVAQGSKMDLQDAPAGWRKAAEYVMLTDGSPSGQTSEFLEAVHEVYRVEKERLSLARKFKQKRMFARADQETMQGPETKKAEVTIRFWKRDLGNTRSK